MTPEQEKQFEEVLKTQLNKSFIQGIRVGTKSLSNLILYKTSKINRNYSKNELLRIIKEINMICERELGNKDTKQEKNRS